MPATVVDRPDPPESDEPDEPDEPPAPKPRIKRDRPDPVKSTPEPPSAPDAAELRAKFQSVTREYRAYKERNGSRLESEWTDLASMVQYLSTPEKRIAFDKKIDRLRAKMRD